MSRHTEQHAKGEQQAAEPWQPCAPTTSYLLLLLFCQVVPIAAAFVLTVSAGAIFGAAKGTAVVLTCSTVSATISFFISRSVGRQFVLDMAKDSPQCAPPTTPLLPAALCAVKYISPLESRRFLLLQVPRHR